MQIKSTLTEPIISTLFGYPLVVADLGNLSSVSPNVMIEVGFRLSTGRPILFLADACSTRETDQGKEQGWVSEHPWVDWRWSLNSAPVYLNANA
jgi:hypothetical protein